MSEITTPINHLPDWADSVTVFKSGAVRLDPRYGPAGEFYSLDLPEASAALGAAIPATQEEAKTRSALAESIRRLAELEREVLTIKKRIATQGMDSE